MSFRSAIKQGVLRLAKTLGLFALARHLTRHQARILCYHGFSFADEHRFSPTLFMQPATFQARLQAIAAAGFEVVPLEQLVDRLERNQPIDNLLVLTVDDGWTGFAHFAWPVLRERQWPCTLYLTTWYAEKERPVANVLRRYLQWRGVSIPAEQADNEQECLALVQAARASGVTVDGDDALFRLSTLPSLRQLAQQGLDLQLHTHRHCLPTEPQALKAEISENRQRITALTGRAADHLCYPSGEYLPLHLPLLTANAVRSATTTRLGLVGRKADRLQLPRILDAEGVSALDFEAELSGFKTLMRRLLTGSAQSAPQQETP